MTGDVVRARRPALVVRVLVADGEPVSDGQPLLVTETMKCEETIRADRDGVAREVVCEGTVVAVHDVLLRLEPPKRSKRAGGAAPANVERVLEAVTREGGVFREYDLACDQMGSNGSGHSDSLVEVRRTLGAHDAGVVVGVIEHPGSGLGDDTTIRRVLIIGDAERALGAVSEAECRRILAAIDLAEICDLPLEWAAVSAGAVISLESGTENMDWCAAVVARLVRFTQRGGEVVVVTTATNVGAQSYWNAEATMLGHCCGMLVMVDGSSMVLTGNKALGLAGGHTETDNSSLGGFHEVMGPNGEAHHRAPDLDSAFGLVLTHHRLARARASSDCVQRSVCDEPYDGVGSHRTIGDILEAQLNPGRKVQFAIRPVMAALVDRDAERLERWGTQAGAEGAVVWDTRMDGDPVTLIGIESHHREPTGESDPSGGWAGATLYPQASKKVARAINTASGRRPVVVLANLAGFDGSRWSLENQQLEWGAEIARAVVNFDGPIVVVVIGRFHGGAYVVFNRQLNPNLVMLAIEGTRVSVIGGSAAADVVLRSEVRRVVEELSSHGDSDDPARTARSLVAERFDNVHDVERAHRVGSIDEVISASRLRPSVIGRLAGWNRSRTDAVVMSPVRQPAGRSAGHA